jgi:hypothetical protein
MKYIYLLIFNCILFSSAFSQNSASLRGNVFDSKDGQPLSFVTVALKGTNYYATSDPNGFYIISSVPPGKYEVEFTFVGHDDVVKETILSPGINSLRVEMSERSIELGGVEISAEKQAARNDVQVSKIAVTQREVKILPSTGGEPDIAQYLSVIPGVVTSGDQGGQIFIRGGSPVMNRITLDGMTIFNPFHSIGFYSVFETEAIRTADVYTGGFNANYGGRINAIVDLKTREGNKKNFSGLVSAGPFQSKILLEGPITTLKEGGKGSISYLFTGKQSYIDRVAEGIYKYAAEENNGLPFSFRDLFGKVSFLGSNGSKLDIFGFDYRDKVDYKNLGGFDWTSQGGAANFTIIPPLSNTTISGQFSYSTYKTNFKEENEPNKTSGLNNLNFFLEFGNYGRNSDFKYGLDYTSNASNLSFVNTFGNRLTSDINNDEIAAFMKYKKKWNKLIFEPGFRAQYYSSVKELSLEPRMALKYNFTDWLRLKAAGGYYSQNLISTVSERDIVNLFVGFLLPGDQSITGLGGVGTTGSGIQKAQHIVGGVEIDVNNYININLEPYYKNFNQLINLNRNKVNVQDSDYGSETGEAYGVDLSVKYDKKPFYIWTTYSWAYVDRFDGFQRYNPFFDRRHNINVLASYNFGKKKNWELGARWNYGSPFPFTRTQGFFNGQNLQDGIGSNVLNSNGDLEVIYDSKRNAGRLPDFHRLDLSLKHTHKFGSRSKLETTASVTNGYNRNNIFYFDRINYRRVDQLPILPALTMVFTY